MTNNKQTIPTFEEFKSSRQTYSWPNCAKLLKIEESWTNAPRAQVYMGRFYIEDYLEEGYEHEAGQRGQYVLILERDVYYGDELITPEKLLYDYLIDQDYFSE